MNLPVATPPIVRQLLDRLGPAVLVKNRYGTKRPFSKGWQNTTLVNMVKAKFLRSFKGRWNIGVLLGKPSDGLCTIDVDDDAAAKFFLALNPTLQGTLRSRGARGCNLWLRMKGGYPNGTIKLITHSGGAWGEFRSTGGQTVIHGMHPSGKLYTLSGTKPLEIEFDSIVWPKEIANAPQLLGTQKSQKVQKNQNEPEGTDEPDDTEVVRSSGFLPRVKNPEDAVRVALPTDVNTNNRCLFTLARAVKALELASGKFSTKQMLEVFDQWFASALPFLKSGQNKEDYLHEFMHAYDHAKHALGSSILPKALKFAKAAPTPLEAEPFTNPDLKLLVGLCKQLQIISGDGSFYLSSRTVQRIFKHETHGTAAKWLSTLVVMQIIERVERGTAVRATRYRYRGKL